jgi:hypothetical protein
MANRSTLSLSLHLGVALVALVFAACSGGGGSEDPAANGAGQQIDGDDDASGDAAGAGPQGVGGSKTEPTQAGSGNTGSVGESEGEGDDEDAHEPAGGGEGGDRNAGEDGAEQGGGPPLDPPVVEPSEAFLRGEALAAENQCVTCHQPNFAGFTVFPNITPDVETGIGSWTDAQIVSAVRDGLDADGSTLCVTMQRYSFSDEQASDLVSFLRGLPAVSNLLPGVCPGHGL